MLKQTAKELRKADQTILINVKLVEKMSQLLQNHNQYLVVYIKPRIVNL